MDFQGHHLLVALTFSLLFLFFHYPLPTNASTNKLVDSVCKKTINNGDCINALESHPRTATTSELKDLAKIAFQMAVANSTESKTYIDDLLNKNHTESIKKCSFWYGAVVGSFRSGLEELDVDALTANYDAKVAADGANNCENALASAGVQVPSISTRNKYVRLYGSIGFEVTNDL
ncbi:hypothetical protein ACJW30_11G015100 [Castanea mollissima]